MAFKVPEVKDSRWARSLKVSDDGLYAVWEFDKTDGHGNVRLVQDTRTGKVRDLRELLGVELPNPPMDSVGFREFSPNGHLFLAELHLAGKESVWVIDPEKSKVRQLMSGGGVHAKWVGGRIAALKIDRKAATGPSTQNAASAMEDQNVPRIELFDPWSGKSEAMSYYGAVQEASGDGAAMLAAVNSLSPDAPTSIREFQKNAHIVAILDGKMKEFHPQKNIFSAGWHISPDGKWASVPPDPRAKTRLPFEIVSVSGEGKALQISGQVCPVRVTDGGGANCVFENLGTLIHIDPLGKQTVLATDLQLYHMWDFSGAYLYYVRSDEPANVYRRKLPSDKPRPIDQAVSVTVATYMKVACLGNGKFQLGEADTDAKALLPACRKAKTDGLSVVLQAEKDATFADVQPVLEACATVGAPLFVPMHNYPIEFPKLSGHSGEEPSRPILVSVYAKGVTELRGPNMAQGPNTVPVRLQQLRFLTAVNGSDKLPVVIKAAMDAPWSVVLDMHKAARDAGFKEVLFAQAPAGSQPNSTTQPSDQPVTGYSNHNPTGAAPLPTGGGTTQPGGRGATFGPGSGGNGHGPKAAFLGLGGNAHHVAYVVDWDAKGSMDSVKQGLLTSISHLAPVQDFQVIFAGPKGPLAAAQNLLPITPENRTNVARFINDFKVKETGDPVAAMNRALEAIAGADKARKGAAIFLVTNRKLKASDELTQLTRQAVEKAVRIYTCSVGDAGEDEATIKVLKDIAAGTGARYKHLSEP